MNTFNQKSGGEPTTVRLNNVLSNGNWSQSCADLFEEILRNPPSNALSPDKGVNAQWFFLRLLLHGGDHKTFGVLTNDVRNAYSTTAMFGECGLTMDQIRERLQSVGGEFNRSRVAGQGFYMDRELASILVAGADIGKKYGNTGITSMRHVVAAFVFCKKAKQPLLEYLALPTLGINPRGVIHGYMNHILNGFSDSSFEAKLFWIEACQRLSYVLQGRTLLMKREAGDHETGLELDCYAEALAQLLKLAPDGEPFTIGIFGHWGRGKTTLLRKTAKQPSTMPTRRLLGALWRRLLPPYDSLRGEVADSFETITFSAWRYPSRPEVWVYLYETIAKAAYQAGFWKSLPCIIRAGIAKNGYKSIMVASIFFAVALVPWSTRLGLAWDASRWVLPSFSLAGLALLIHSYLAVKGAFQRLRSDYLIPTRHSDRLGLQATIGEDLAAMLKGWLPQRSYGAGFYVTASIWLSTVAALMAWRINGVAGQGWAYPATAAFIVLAVGYLLCAWIFPWNILRKKCLLIVDDLDRCDPKHLLAVIESIKLMLEDAEVSNRIVCAILVEEDVLRHAIWEKYQFLVSDRPGKGPASTYNCNRLVQEHVEKLFTVHLRLEPLGEGEIQEVIARFGLTSPAMQDAGDLKDRHHDVSQPNDPSRTSESISGTFIVPAASLHIGPDTDFGIYAGVNSGVLLDSRERTAIAEEFAQAQCKDVGTAALIGPRFIRCFVFRYFLARLILERRGITQWEPVTLIKALRILTFGGNFEVPVFTDPRVMVVLKQVVLSPHNPA